MLPYASPFVVGTVISSRVGIPFSISLRMLPVNLRLGL